MYRQIRQALRLVRAAGFGLCLTCDLFAGVSAAPAHADQYIETVRVTCAPEIPLFRIEYSAINEDASFFLYQRTVNHVKNPWRLIRKYGYLPAEKFDYTCKLPNATYRILGSTPPHLDHGECGGNPRTRLSLLINGTVILDKVYLTETCFPEESPAHLGTIDAHGGYDGWGGGALDVQLYDNDGHSADLWGIGPLDQKTMDCIITKPGFLKESGIYDARHACGIR